MKQIEFYVDYIDKEQPQKRKLFRSRKKKTAVYSAQFKVQVEEDLTDDFANKVTETLESWKEKNPNFEIVTDIYFL